MITVQVNLSGNLKAILPDQETTKKIELEQPTSIYNVLLKADINPAVVVKVLVEEEVKPKDYIIREDTIITLIGPLAGG